MTALRAFDPWVRIAELEEERDYYKRELGLLLDEGRLADLGRALACTPQEARLLGALHAAHPRLMTKSALHQALYGAREAETDIKIVDLLICKLRKREGVEIETVWGRGYRLADAIAQRLRLVMEPRT